MVDKETNERIGKTCLLVQFADNKFSKDIASTVGIDFRVKRTEYKGQQIKLQIVCFFKN